MYHKKSSHNEKRRGENERLIAISDNVEFLSRLSLSRFSFGTESEDTDELLAHEKGGAKKVASSAGIYDKSSISLPRKDLIALIGSLTDQMRNAASELQFEVAARLRDEIKILKKELRMMEEAGV